MRALVVSFLLLATPALADSSAISQTERAAQADLRKSLDELAALRKSIAEEKIPLNGRMRSLERRLIEVRDEYDRVSKRVDTSALDVTTFQAEIQGREEEKRYLGNLVGEYVRNLESCVHISELQRYRGTFDAARDAASAEPQIQAAIASIDRLLELSGGTVFEGKAVGPTGDVHDGTFATIGPVVLFRSSDGATVGLAEQKLGSLEPNVVAVREPGADAQIAALVASRSGTLPFDPTLGNASKIEDTRESLVVHIEKGGPVMVPILLMAAAALVVGVIKWVQISRVRNASPLQVQGLLTAIAKGDVEGAAGKAAAIRGPVGEMLKAGVEHAAEPRELVEEVMFERALEARLRLQSFLPFIAMSASAAPLLGLLGTVTGMINTFKLITVFGSGDPKTLSSGISEALITTEYGLIVAIPSLLLYAYLSRRAKGVLDSMEKTAVSFLNRLSVRPAA